MSSRTRVLIRLLALLVILGVVAAITMLWLAAMQSTVQGAGNTEPQLTPKAYLLLVARLACAGDVIVNGGLEDGEVGWHQYTTGENWKVHELIGSDSEGRDWGERGQ